MALENVGLGGVLTFDEKAAVAGMKNAGGVADKFTGQFGAITNVAKSVGQAMGQVAGAIGAFGIASLPATAIIGAGTKVAVDFEKQMSAVGAVTQASAADMAMLTKVAKEQGASTSFSATQAAQGLELLALGGFDAKESVEALPAVLSAAAADGIELSQSAEIVAMTLKSLNIPVTDATTGLSNATRVADVLAMTSGKTATSILDMGEALRYAAPEARTLGIDLETTAGFLGLVADAGLKGSVGGTAFTSALVKLAKPSKKGAELIERFGISMTKTKDGGLDVIDVFKQLDAKTKGVSDVMERAAIVNEIFGERGSKAFTAMQTAIASGKADTLVAELKNAKGYAEKMAKTRLDNFAGSVEQLTGALEGFALETTGRFLGPAKESIQMYTDMISSVVLVLQELNSEEGLTDATAEKAGGTMVAIAKGIKEGLDIIIAGWRNLRSEITGLIERFSGEQSPEMIQQFAKIATIIFIVAGALAPVLVALGGVAMFVSSVILPAFTAIGGVIGSLFSAPVLGAIALVVGAFLLLRNEGESVGQTFTRIVDGIVTGFNWVMDNAIKPFAAGLLYAIGGPLEYIGEQFIEFFHSMHDTFANVIGAIIHIAQTLAPVFSVLFTFIGNVVGVVAATIGFAFTTALWVVQGIVKTIGAIISAVIDGIAYAIRALAMGVGGIGEMLGLDWGEKMRKWGQSDFDIQVKADTSKPEKKIADTSIDAAELAELDKQAQNEMLAMQVGKAVGENMPKEISVESKVCVDGKTIAKATAKHKQELADRAGFKATPWQRRALAEHGAAPVGGA